MGFNGVLIGPKGEEASTRRTDLIYLGSPAPFVAHPQFWAVLGGSFGPRELLPAGRAGPTTAPKTAPKLPGLRRDDSSIQTLLKPYLRQPRVTQDGHFRCQPTVSVVICSHADDCPVTALWRESAATNCSRPVSAKYTPIETLCIYRVWGHGCYQII